MKIAAVITSRNDNYGGHLPHRARLALTNFIERYDEVVYVDWNSTGRSLLDEIRDHLPKNKKLKHIVLSPDDVGNINSLYKEIQIVEVVGRNIGIRIAESDFIVSTNIDIIADRPDTTSLDTNTLYTVPRRDVAVEEFLHVDNAVHFGNNLISNYTKYIPKPDANRPEDHGDPWSLVVCCGDYQLAHRSLWYKMRGFEESMLYRNFADSNLMKKGSIYGNISKLDLPIFHLNHSGHGDGTGGVAISNNKDQYIKDFTATTNSDNWGNYIQHKQIEII